MLPDYHQLEFDMRLYLVQLELNTDWFFKRQLTSI
jgi:hypothetical protein